VAKQQAFIESHDKLLNSLGNDEAVLFVTIYKIAAKQTWLGTVEVADEREASEKRPPRNSKYPRTG
jgi:hypothetical protein